MQAEIERLTKETRELREAQELKAKVIRHDEPFITIEGHPDSEMYCATCYGKDKNLIQVRILSDGAFACPLCKTFGIYDHNLDRHSRKTNSDVDAAGFLNHGR